MKNRFGMKEWNSYFEIINQVIMRQYVHRTYGFQTKNVAYNGYNVDRYAWVSSCKDFTCLLSYNFRQTC